jgi:hypothetical protein
MRGAHLVLFVLFALNHSTSQVQLGHLNITVESVGSISSSFENLSLTSSEEVPSENLSKDVSRKTAIKNLRIGSFNIQSLGSTKMGRPEFVSIVTQILAKYDIVLIQEIKDSTVNMKVINDLVKILNELVE